jgi:hypothetical protein
LSESDDTLLTRISSFLTFENVSSLSGKLAKMSDLEIALSYKGIEGILRGDFIGGMPYLLF